jgi:prepilin-type processing-associated H-X9-DG protein
MVYMVKNDNTNSGTGGYGYSVGIGTYTTINGMDSAPAKQVLLTNPAQTIMFADHASVENRQYNEQIDLYAPIFMDRDEKIDYYGPASPTMHFRHSNRVNVCWADGHVDSRGPLSYSQEGWTCSAEELAANFKLGWFGGDNEEDIAELFRVKKTKR